MPGTPDISEFKKPGFDYHFVNVEEIGGMRGRGWQIIPEYSEQWPANPGGLLQFPMHRKSAAPPKPEYFDMATAVRAVKNTAEGIPKVDPEDLKRIFAHLDKLVPKEVKEEVKV